MHTTSIDLGSKQRNHKLLTNNVKSDGERMSGISSRDGPTKKEIPGRSVITDVVKRINRLKWSWPGHIFALKVL